MIIMTGHVIRHLVVTFDKNRWVWGRLFCSSDNEEEATYHFSTMIDARDNPISGEEIYQIQLEAERTGKSFAFVAQKKLKDRVKLNTIISPSDSIPNIASRTEHKRR